MRLFELTEGFWSEINYALGPKCDFCSGEFQREGEELQPYGERTTGEPFNVCSVCKAVEQDRAKEPKQDDMFKEDFDERVAAMPPREGDTAYVIHMNDVKEVKVMGKSIKFGGTHEVLITSEGGHQGLLYPVFGQDLFKTKEEAKKALFKNRLGGEKPRSAGWRAPRW